MPLSPQPLLSYLTHSSAPGAEALGAAHAVIQDADAATLKPAYRYVQNYLSDSAVVLGRTMTGAPEQAVTELPLRFVDADLVDLLFSSAEPDGEAVGRLGFVAAALGADPRVTHYEIDEFQDLLAGTAPDLYHDHAFLLTLRAAAAGTGAEYGAALLHTLPIVTTEDSLRTEFSWDEALLFALSLHTVWRYFPVASEREQQFLLQNYFYHGLAAGVPVRMWLVQSLAAVENPAVRMGNYLQALLGSTEMVPTAFDVSAAQTVSSLLRAYLTALSTDSIPTLAQEKFMANFYRIGESREAYRSWLREMLNIATRLKSGEIVQE